MPAKQENSNDQPKRGRPSKFSDAIASEICDRLSRGEPLAVICREAHMPAVATVSDWKKAHQSFFVAIARAREEGFDAIAAQCMEIADDEKHDWVLSKKGMLTSEVAIGRARLRVETRLKLLAKWDPKRYGEKLAVDANHSGAVRVVIGGNADE